LNYLNAFDLSPELSFNFCSIIGEDKILSIKFGSGKGGSATSTLGPDDILVRGPAAEVDRAIREIRHIAEEAKIDEIEGGYVGIFLLNRLPCCSCNVPRFTLDCRIRYQP
jgi:hypothetical protein